MPESLPASASARPSTLSIESCGMCDTFIFSAVGWPRAYHTDSISTPEPPPLPAPGSLPRAEMKEFDQKPLSSFTYTFPSVSTSNRAHILSHKVICDAVGIVYPESTPIESVCPLTEALRCPVASASFTPSLMP